MTEKELKEYCFDTMIIKRDGVQLLNSVGVDCKANEKAGIITTKLKENIDIISIEVINHHLREKWLQKDMVDTSTLVKLLTSKKLIGHNWYGASPSKLHAFLQEKVRNYLANQITFDSLMEIGSNIVRHECFITAVHDLVETYIIQSFSSVIPPNRKKSISDFIFNGIPYDLKVTKLKKELSDFGPRMGKLSVDEKMELTKRLYGGTDSLRNRTDAESNSFAGAQNRMYIVLSEPDKWLVSPEKNLKYILKELKNRNNFFSLVINNSSIDFCLIDM